MNHLSIVVKLLKYLPLLLLLSGCKLLKNVDKKETETASREEVVTQTTRVGDTVTYEVPKYKFKDTTIYTVNRVGTRIETRYDEEGNIDLINCYASQINELTKKILELQESTNEKQKVEEAKTDPVTWGIVIGALILTAGLVFFLVRKFS